MPVYKQLWLKGEIFQLSFSPKIITCEGDHYFPAESRLKHPSSVFRFVNQYVESRLKAERRNEKDKIRGGKKPLLMEKLRSIRTDISGFKS
jgi:hypothetical protein